MEVKIAQLQAKIDADQGFAEKLLSLENPEEVQSFLKAQELDFSLEEINMLREALVKILAKGENAELSDEDLEEVAGGFVITAGMIGAAAGVASALFAGGNFTHNVTRGRW